MRKCIGGNGLDNSAALISYLASGRRYTTAFLYLIGEPEHPQAIWATDHETPLVYNWLGTFQPAAMTKSALKWKVGLDSQNCKITWGPANRTFTNVTSTTSPLALTRIHFYDNWPVRIWKVYMPTPGDCNTLGAIDWFGGRVGDTTSGRGYLQFSVDDFMSVLTQKLPANVIEVTNTMAGYTAATAPPSSSIPVFETFTGSTENNILGDCLTPTFGHVYDNNTFNGGYMIFLAGTGATLAGAWSAVGISEKYTDGHGNEHNEFQLYASLPYPPTPGVDKFYVSQTAPINLGDESYFGFPWVPTPQTAV